MAFDYMNWPHQPAKGIRGNNNNHLTQALFYDKLWNADLGVYVLQEEDYTSEAGKTYPSAYQIILQASSEYDAMRKLVGSSEQWDKLKALDWFSRWLDKALTDQENRIQDDLKKVLIDMALDGDKQAAKLVLDMGKKKPVGRPKKERNGKAPSDDVEQDLSRVVEFKR